MNSVLTNIFVYIVLIIISVVLYFVSRSNYLLFHAIAEIYSIIIAAGIFFVSWNSRTHSRNHNLIFLGISYVFVAIIDFFHVLSYKGMNIFTDYSFYANQLWICARMMESMSLLLFVLFGLRKIRIIFSLVFAFYSTVTSLCLLSVFIWKIFPICFIQETGQTPFKIINEYIIIFILALSLLLIIITRTVYDRKLFIQITWSIIFTIISEFCFTIYTDNYGITNVIGHLFKVLSFYLIYQSIIVNTLKRPFDILYRELNDTKAILETAMDQSSAGIAISEAPGGILRYINKAGLIILGYNTGNNSSGTIPVLSYDHWKLFDSDGIPMKKEETPLTRAVMSGETTSREILLSRDDGKECIVLANAAPVRNTNGEIISGIVVFQDITKRKLAEEKIITLLNEKKLILKEVHHRIKNNMNTIISMLTLQADAQNNPINKNILSEAASRVESMSVLYDKLYRSENDTSLSLKEYLPALINEITGIFYYKNSVKIETNIDNIILSSKILSPLGIIINELITNSMKYAFEGSSDGIIYVEALQKDNHVSLVFKDNGIGIPESVTFENSYGFGMQLIRILTEQINGSVTIERKEGSKFIIEFDI